MRLACLIAVTLTSCSFEVIGVSVGDPGSMSDMTPAPTAVAARRERRERRQHDDDHRRRRRRPTWLPAASAPPAPATPNAIQASPAPRASASARATSTSPAATARSIARSPLALPTASAPVSVSPSAGIVSPRARPTLAAPATSAATKATGRAAARPKPPAAAENKTLADAADGSRSRVITAAARSPAWAPAAGSAVFVCRLVIVAGSAAASAPSWR